MYACGKPPNFLSLVSLDRVQAGSVAAGTRIMPYLATTESLLDSAHGVGKCWFRLCLSARLPKDVFKLGKVVSAGKVHSLLR